MLTLPPLVLCPRNLLRSGVLEAEKTEREGSETCGVLLSNMAENTAWLLEFMPYEYRDNTDLNRLLVRSDFEPVTKRIDSGKRQNRTRDICLS